MSNPLYLPSEHDEQSNFVKEVHYQYRNDPTFIPELFYAVLNGAWIAGEKRRKGALIAKYKDEGWKSGISDIKYDQPRGGHPYLCIEMKRSDRRGEKDGGLSPEQKAYLGAARKVGAFTAVCYDADDAIRVFNTYMNMEPNHE